MPPPSQPPADYVALFESERRELVEFLSRVAPEQWALPSPCPGWTCSDLLLHLVGDDFSILARHRDHHVGMAPPAGADDREFIGWLDELQRSWVAAARRISPRLAIDLLRWAGPQLLELFRGQDPSSVTAHVSWANAEPVPVWLDHARELSEYWIHRQQLRRALGLPSDLSPPVLGPVLNAFRWAYPFRLGGAGREGDSVRVRFTGSGGVIWTLVRSHREWNFTTADLTPTAALEATVDDGWRLLTNNLPDDEKTRLVTTGDPGLVRILLDTRSIIGTPK